MAAHHFFLTAVYLIDPRLHRFPGLPSKRIPCAVYKTTPTLVRLLLAEDAIVNKPKLPGPVIINNIKVEHCTYAKMDHVLAYKITVGR